ncbi:MAG: transglutaminaseTgpA domain-containing protein [Clostridia bacterium]
MRKPAIFTNERLSRLMVSFLLCAGLLLPLLLSFEIGGLIPLALTVSISLLCLFVFVGGHAKGGLITLVALSAFGLIQLFIPNMGFFGSCYEALKALSLYLTGITAAAPLFAAPIALLLAVALAMLSFAFSSKNVGFLPATILVVLVLFGLWSLGKPMFFWLVLPALVALLLLISQSSHEKINLFEVLPMAAIVVVLSMLILPRGQTILPPLYNAAMDLKQTISDYLFFTEPRNVFTLGSYGYYPMGNGKLGGEAEPTDLPVMTVKTSKRTLLRAVIKDEYTGRNWRDTSSGKRYLYVNPRWSDLRSDVYLETLPEEAMRSASDLLTPHTVEVQMQNTATSTLFTPVSLRDFNGMGNLVPYFNDASELFTTRDLARGDRFSVSAPVLEGGDGGLGALVDAAPKGDDPYYDEIYKKYTWLPEHMEQKVYMDARNIVSVAKTPYEQASAIMRHLQRYYKYTLTPDTPPENQDFVTYFLYVGKEGYCTYFASAMTVLCRMTGLPARYVEGFLATPSADGLAYVTGKEAHAWTEVYFEGFGWVPFDATPAQENLDKQPKENDSPAPTPEPSPEPEPSPSPEPPDSPSPTEEPDPQEEEPPEAPPDDQPPFAWWWLLLAAAAIGGLCVRVHVSMPEQVARKQKTEQDKLFIYGNATYALMKLVKRVPKTGETPLSFARRMDKQKALPVPILPLWRMLALSNYSRMAPGAEQTARARETFLRVYQSQKLLVKLRFMGKVLVGRSCYHALETKLEHVEPAKLFTYQQRGEKDKKSKQRRGGKGTTGGGKATQGGKPKTGDGKPTRGPRISPTDSRRSAPMSDPRTAPSDSRRSEQTSDPRIAPTDSRRSEQTSDPRTAPTDSRRIAPTSDPRTAPTDSRRVAPPNDPRIAPTTDPRTVPTDPLRITPTINPRNAPSSPSSSITPASSVPSRRTRKRR